MKEAGKQTKRYFSSTGFEVAAGQALLIVITPFIPML